MNAIRDAGLPGLSRQVGELNSIRRIFHQSHFASVDETGFRAHHAFDLPQLISPVQKQLWAKATRFVAGLSGAVVSCAERFAARADNIMARKKVVFISGKISGSDAYGQIYEKKTMSLFRKSAADLS